MMAALWRDALRRPADAHVVANADDPMVVWAARGAANRDLGRVRPALARRLLGLPGVRLAHRTRTRTTGAAPAATCAARTPQWTVDGDARGRPGRRPAPGHAAAARAGSTGPTRPPRSRSPPSSACARPTPRRAWPRSPRSPAGTPRSSATAATIRLLLAKNPAGWLEAFDMAEDAPTLLSINARDPDGLDTSWLFDVDFSPLRGRQVLITGDRAIDLAVRLEVNEVPFTHVTSFGEALADGAARAGSRSSRTTPRSRTSERSWTVSTEPRHRARRLRPRVALRIVWLYPDLLSTYGDRGNMLILARRADLRGLPVETIEVRSDQAVPEHGDIYLLGGGEDGPQALAAAAAQRRPRPAPGGRARRRRCSWSAPATSWSAPRSSPRAPSTPASACSTSAPTAGPPGPSASSPATPDPALGLPTAHRLREPRRPHAPRPRPGPARPGDRRRRQRRHHRGRLVRARSSAPTCTARRWPATRPSPTCCCAGRPAVRAGADRRHLARPAARRAPRRDPGLTRAARREGPREGPVAKQLSGGTSRPAPRPPRPARRWPG